MSPKMTLAGEIRMSGPGTHTGRNVELRLKPCSSGRIVFRRTDLGGAEISPDPHRAEAKNCTLLVGDGAEVGTVEHLMAALLILGVDSLDIELTGPEIPILDGSALPFVRAVLEAGTVPLAQARSRLRIVRPLSLVDGAASIEIRPDTCFRISYSIEYEHPSVGAQELSLVLDPEVFVREVAPARTFGFLKDVQALKSRGLIKGSSPDNAVVLDETGVMNPPLRFEDEFVRHKILDLVGDLSLLGSLPIGHFSARRAGHSLHLRAVRMLRDDPGSWTLDEG